MSFLSDAQIESIRERFGTPVYVYDQQRLEEAADRVLAFPVPGRLVARFAMKALPTAAVLQIFDARDLHIDASSGF
ncbi:MAG: diaminopimelate decarboxylase, partial [Deltaproteobacteria bacterium]|nr:diaminopimelate decarboxylase [Deltaproteobacteria bacterium]